MLPWQFALVGAALVVAVAFIFIFIGIVLTRK